MMNKKKSLFSPFSLMITLTVCILTPFSNDLYISSLPEIANKLMTKQPQMILSVFLTGLAFSQLIYGPISDRFGRKPVLLFGLCIYILSSFSIVLTNSFSLLLIARFFQAIGTCSAIVSTFAIIRDSFPKEQIVKTIALFMAIIGICPILAPIIGSFLQIHWGWRASFILLLLMGIFFFIWVACFFKESLKEKNLTALNMKQIFLNYKMLISHQEYKGYVLTSCFSYSGLFCYIVASPFILTHHFGLSLDYFGIVFALNTFPLILMAYIAPKLANKYGLPKTVFLGALILFIGGILCVCSLEWFPYSIINYVAAMSIVYIGVGIIRPTASAGAMHLFPPKYAGSSAALFSFLAFLGGAVFSSLVGNFLTSSLLPFNLLMTLFGALAVLNAYPLLPVPDTKRPENLLIK